MRSLKEQRKEFAAFQQRVATDREEADSRMAEMAQLFQSQIRGLQQIVEITNKSIDELRVSNLKLTAMMEFLVQQASSPQSLATMSVSPLTVLPGLTAVTSPVSTALRAGSQRSAQLLSPQLQQQRQGGSPTTHSALAVPAPHDSGMVVSDE